MIMKMIMNPVSNYGNTESFQLQKDYIILFSSLFCFLVSFVFSVLVIQDDNNCLYPHHFIVDTGPLANWTQLSNCKGKLCEGSQKEAK